MITNADKEAGVPPRPWRVWKEEVTNPVRDDVGTFECWGILDAEGCEVVITDAGYYPPNLETAEFIVRCIAAIEQIAKIPPVDAIQALEIARRAVTGV